MAIDAILQNRIMAGEKKDVFSATSTRVGDLIYAKNKVYGKHTEDKDFYPQYVHPSEECDEGQEEIVPNAEDSRRDAKIQDVNLPNKSYEIEDGQVVICTASCDITCKPIKMISHDSVEMTILVLSKDNKAAFNLNRDINVSLNMMGADGKIIREDVFYRGITFSYEDVIFLVFEKS